MRSAKCFVSCLLLACYLSNSLWSAVSVGASSLRQEAESHLGTDKSTSMAESPGENYFSTWLQLREMREYGKGKDLLNRLTGEENVTAVKQTYDWLIEQERQSSGKEYEHMAWLAVRDFAGNYFSGSPDRHPRPFLEMLEDSTLDSRVRLWLIKCLDKQYDKERACFQVVFDSLIRMMSDASEPLELRKQAQSTISRLLGHQYYRVRMSQEEVNYYRLKAVACLAG